MKRDPRNRPSLCFRPVTPPKLRVGSGERFVVETKTPPAATCARRAIALERPFIDETWPPSANPVAAELCRGVRRGDLPGHKIEDILCQRPELHVYRPPGRFMTPSVVPSGGTLYPRAAP